MFFPWFRRGRKGYLCWMIDQSFELSESMERLGPGMIVFDSIRAMTQIDPIIAGEW